MKKNILNAGFGQWLVLLAMCLSVQVNAQITTISSTTFTNNNGSGQVTFNLQNTNPYPIKITAIEGVVGTAGSNTCDLWYKTTPVSGATGAISNANGWYIAATGSFTGVANTTTSTTQPFLTGINFIIPPFTTYGIDVFATGQRYSTIAAGTTTISGGGVNFITGTNIGYGVGTPPTAPTNTPRGWIGKITFEPAYFSYNDAGIKSLVSPLNFCGGMQDVKLRIANFGHNRLDSLRVNWKLDGVTQPTYFYTAGLDTLGNPLGNSSDTVITLGSINFSTSAGKQLVAWTSFPNGVADTTQLNDSLSAFLKPSLSGTYTVGGTGASYSTLSAIAQDMSNYGICGPVEIVVNPGVYSGKVSFNAITGVSAINKILLRGTNKNTCILSDSIADALLVVSNTSYFAIRNLTITNKQTAACSGISIVGNTTNNKGSGSSIVNCNVNLPNAIGSPSSCIFVSGSTLAGSNHNMDSITIDSNNTLGGYYGMVVYGNTGQLSALNKGFLVRNNTLTNPYVYGLYMYYIYNPTKVLYNTIIMNPANVSTGYALYHYYCRNMDSTMSTEVIGNRAINPQYMGIYLYSPGGTINNPIKVYNNSVSGNMAYSTNYAFYLNSPSTIPCNYEMFHNTIHVNGSGTTQYGFYYLNSGNVNGLNCKNNIFSLYSTAGTTLYPAYFSSNPTLNLVNYNLYSNTRNSTLGYRGAAFTTLNYLDSTKGGDSSFNRIPPFVSNTDLRLTDGCNRGVNLSASVPTDYTGISRGLSPSPGLYEYVTVSNDLTVDLLISPSFPVGPGAQNLVARVKNSGNNTVTSFNVSYKLNGGTPVTLAWSGTLLTCDTVQVTFSGANQITIGTGANAIKVYTSSPNAGADGNTSNDTLNASFIYYPPLNGNYTIGGPTANFANFADATNVLQNSGIAGPVKFTINPGTYTAAVSLNGPVIGSNAINTITFEGNNKDSVIISVNTAGPAFKVNQVSYVSLRNLTVTNLIAGNGSGIALIGNTSNTNGKGFNVVKCAVNLPNTGTSTSYGIIVTGNVNGTADANQWTDSVTLDSNTITGAYYGIQISTSANLNAAYNRGHRIRYNTLLNTYYYGIRFYYIANPADIIGNKITMNPSNASSYGVYLYYNQHTSTTPTRFKGNTISAGYAGLYYYYWTTGASVTEIHNNMVRISGSYAGMYLYTAATGGGTLSVYHNSILTTGGSTNYGMYYYNSTGTGISYFKNNIFAALGGTTTPAYFSTNPVGNVINYNVYHNAGGGNLGFRGGAFNATNYKTATTGGDTSFNVSPAFVSNTDLHLTNACIKGVDLSSQVNTDIDNNTRSITPVIGAHEAQSFTNDLTLVSFTTPGPLTVGSQNLTALIRNQSGNSVASFDLKYRINGGAIVSYPWTGTLAGCDTLSVTLSGVNALNLLNGYNSLVMYTANPNGTIDNNPANDTLRFVLSTVSTTPGNALQGNGTNKYIRVNHDPRLDIGRNMTIEAWVNLPDPATRNQKIISKTKLPTSGRGFIFALVNGQLLPEVWDSVGTKTTHTSTASVPANTWTHIALTWESGVAMKSYINGVQVATTSISSGNPIGFSSSELAIGVASWDFGSFPVNGMVDEIRIWNTTLDTTTLRKNMHRMVPANSPGLVSYFQLNEPTASTLVSDGINGLQGAIINGPYLTNSTIPAGGDSTLLVSAFSSGSASLKGLNITLTDPFDNNVDLILNEVPNGPNSLPTGVAYTLADRYWIVNAIGNPGTFSGNFVFSLPTNQINAADTALRLYNRGAYGNGAWTLLQTVNASSISGGAATFSSISTLGQFTLASNGNSPLPVNLILFGAERRGEEVQLNWATASERNSKGFVIERASNNSGYASIGFVASQNSNSNKQANYSFTDLHAPIGEVYYYRLKQTDLDGKFAYSPVVKVQDEEIEEAITLYPNPFNNQLWIKNTKEEAVKIQIFDMQGRIIYKQLFEGPNATQINALPEWEAGIYFIQVNDKQPVKFLKN